MSKKARTNKARIAIALTIVLLTLYGLMVYAATPTGPTVNYVSNSTSSTAGQGTLRNLDDGGYLTTVTLDVIQQNFGWKAYVGNITGKLTLDDAQNYTIYDWSLSSINARVYVSRNQAVVWGNIGCADSGVINAEDTALGKAGTSDESIINTFNTSVHKQFSVAGTTIAQSTCPAIATYVNDTAQGAGVNNKFQEVLLNDSSGNLVYTTIAEPGGADGYRNGTQYDFQVIIPDDEAPATITGYYFYVEIGN